MKKLTLSFKSSRALGPASRLALAGSFAALLSHAAHADLTWDSTATATNNWSLTAGNENWLGGPVLWTQNENAIFNLASGTPEAIDVTTAGIIFNNMTFDVSGFSITSAGAGSLVLADDLASTITVTNLADTATISETIANSANGISTLTKAGNGTLILTNAANTFSNLSVSAGTLQANTNGGINQTGLGVAAASISTGATVNLLSGNTAGTFTTINNAFTGTGLLKLTFLNNTTAKNTSLANINGFSGTIQLSNLGTNSDKLNVSNQGNVAAALIVDAGSQIYNSGGTTNFNGGISITGTGNNENRGVIRLAVTAVLGGNISLAGSSTIGLDSTAGAYLTGNISAGVAGTQTLTFGGAGAGTGTLSGVLSNGSGTLALTKNNAGTLVLSGANTYTGATAISASGGAIQLGSSINGFTTGSLSPSSSITVGTSGTFIFNRSNNIVQGTDFGNFLAGAGGIAQNGAGTTTFGTATQQLYTGSTQVNRGTLVLDFANLATSTNMVSASSQLSLGGGTLSLLGKATGTTAQTFNGTAGTSGSSTVIMNRNGGTSTTLNLAAFNRVAGNTVTFQPATAWTTAVSTTEIVSLASAQTSGAAVTLPTTGNVGYLGAGVFQGSGTGTRYAQVRNTSGVYNLVAAPSSTPFLTSVGSTSTVYSMTAAQTLAGALDNYALIGNSGTSVAIANAGFAYTLNGFLNVQTGTITLSGAGNIVIGAEKDFVVNNTNTGGLTISSVLANNAGGASSVTIASTGAGTTTLSGANTYTGSTFLNRGTLAITTDAAASAAAQLGTVPAAATGGNITFSGGTLSIAPTAAMTINANRGIQLNAGGGTITNTAAQTVTYGGIVAGVGGITLNVTNSGGGLTWGANSSYTGPTTLSGAGTLFLQSSDNAFGLGGTLTLNGMQIRSSSAAARIISNPLVIAANTTFPTVATEKSLTFSGPTVLSGGTRTLTSAVGSTVGNTSVQFTNAISESTALSGLIKAGAGEVQLFGPNTFTGPTSITAGRLTYGKNFSLYKNTPASWTAANITVASAATLNLRVGGINEFTAANVDTLAALGTATGGFQNGSYLGLDTTSGNFSYGTVLANTNSGANSIGLMKLGTNNLTLTNANTYTGITFIGGGTLVAGNTAAFGPAGNDVYFTAAVNGALAGGFITNGNLELATDTSVNAYDLFGSTSFASTLTLNRATPGVAINQTLGALAWGNNVLNTVSGTNNTSGVPSVSFTGMNISAGSAGTSTLNPTTATIAITGAVNIGVNSQLKTLGLDGTIAGNSISGDITNGLNTLSLTKSNTSTWTVSGNNTYTGTTAVNAGTLILSGTNTGIGATNIVGGTLQAGANGSLNPNSAVTMTDAAAAVLDLNGKTGTIASLAGGGALGGNVTLGAGTLTTGDGNSTTYAGAISGTGNLIKAGIGTFTLSSTQGYTGTTAVNAGTLLVNNTLASSAVTVANAATLSGTGTLSGTTTISSGGILSPATGTTAGTLTFGGLTLDAGSTLAYEFGGTSDLVAVTGVNGLTLNGGALSLYAAGGATPLTANGTYTLFTYNTGFLGALTNLSVTNSQAGKTYAVNDVGGSITLTLGTATSSEWNGAASPDITWTTAGNWSAGTPNSLGAVATLGTIPTAATTINVDGPKTLGAIIFDNANAYTVSGGATDIITLDNGIAAGAISVTTGNHAINAPIALNGPANLTPATGTSLTLGGVISGTKALSVSGAGAVTLGASNTISGGVNLNSGTLNLNDAAALGSGPLTIAGGSIDAPAGALVLSTNNAQTWNGNFTFTGTNNLDLGTGAVSIPISRTVTTTVNTLTVGGIISGSGLTKQGAGTLALSGNNTFTGALTVSAGSVILSGNNVARPAGLSNLTTVANAATLQLQANAGNTTAGISNTLSTEQTAGQPLILSSGSTLQLRGDSNVTFAGANNMGGMGSATIGIDVNQLSGAGSNQTLTMAPAGFNVSATTFNVTGGNGYTLRFPSITSTGGNTSTYAPTTAKLSIGNYSATAANAVLGLAGTSTGNTVTGVIASTNVSVLKTGTSTWELSGLNTYTGTTTVREGTLILSGGRTGAIGTITVSDAAGLNATLNITGGTYAMGGTALNVGNAATTAATGTVNQTGGAISFTSGNGLLVGQNIGVGNTGIYNMSGGSLTTFASTTRGIILGTNSAATGTFNLSGTGTLNMTAATGGGGDGLLQIGRYDSAADNTTALFNQTGGTANVGILSIGGNGTTSIGLNSTLTITDGTFTANQFPRLAAGNTNTATINIGGTADVTLPAFPTARGTSSTATINFDGGVLRPAAASATYMGGLTNAFIKAGGAKFDVANTKDITITQNLLTDAVSLNGGLTKDGAGTLTLTGANTYTGPTTISGGTLQLGSAGTTGTLSTSSAIVNNGNFTISRSNAVAQGTDFSGAAITGSGSLTYTGDSTLTLNAANSYAGLTTFSPTGTNAYTSKLIISNASALGTTAAGTVINGATGSGGTGVQLVLSAAGMTVADEALTLASDAGKRASLYTNTVGTQTWNGNILSSGAGLNAFWSDATGAVLVVGSDATDTITHNASTLSLRGFNGAGTVNSTINGTGALFKTDSSTWTIASTGNSYAGDTTINTGILSIASIADSGANSSIGAGAIINLGQNQAGGNGTGTLQFTGTSGGSSNRAIAILNGATGGSGIIENTVAGQTLTLSGNISTSTPASASTLTLTGAGNGVFSGAITGAPNLAFTKSGTGTWSVSGANTYTGKTTIANGTLSVDNVAMGAGNQALGQNAALDIGVAATSSGALVYTGAAATLDKNINILGNGSDTVQNSGSGLLTLSGNLTKTGTTLTLKGGANGITISGVIQGTNTLFNSDLIVDGGTTNLTNANTYEGPTFIINGATLNANAADALPTANGRTLINLDQSGSGTSTLSLGANQSIAALTGASTSTVALGGTTLTVGKTTGTTTFAGAITGSSGSLTKDGASIQILSGTNTYTGTTTINSGTLALGSGGSLSDLTAVVVNSPGSFDISGISSSERIASLSGASGSTLKLGAKTLEFGDATDTSFAGSVESDSGGTLKKIGIGTFTLTASGYTGTGPNINISQGTLLTGVDNLLPSSAFTLSGGTLATGTFSNTVGSLSVTSDSVINFAGGGTPVFTFASQGTWSGVLSVWNWSGSAWSSGTGGQLKFLDGSDGAILDGTKVKFYSGSGTGLISEGGGFIGTELVPVPEPTTLLSCSLLLGVIGFQRRRKGSRSIES